MVFDEAGLLRAPVRWYFTPPGALPLEGPHAFVSSNWLTVPQQVTGIGEAWDAVRVYDKGTPPAGVTGTGQPCGSANDWLNGVPSDAPRLTLGPNGVSTCCGGDTGGIFVGGGRLYPCIPLLPGALVYVRTALAPTFVQMLEYLSGHWAYTYPGMLQIDAVTGTGGLGNLCLGPVTALYYPGSYNITRNANFLSWDRSTSTSTWVVPPGLPTSPVDNLWIQVLIYNRLQRTSGGIRPGGMGVAQTIFRITEGGLLVGGSSSPRFPSSHSGGILPGGSALVVRHHPGDLNAGIFVGGSSGTLQRIAGSGGLQAGGSSTMRQHIVAGGGVELGGSTSEREVRSGTGGLRPGGTSAGLFPRPGTGGIKPGGTSSRRSKVNGTGGLKPGGTSGVRLRIKGTGGLQAGGTSSVSQGLLELCCPHRVFPTTLYATNSLGHKFTATYDSTNKWWLWLDTDVPHAFELSCKLVGSSYVWQVVGQAQAHCTSASTVNSLSCGPPFNLGITCVVSGGSCLYAGTYRYTITET